MDEPHDELRRLIQDFVRGFGLLAADRTPCGKPLASSDAHALMVLLEAGEDGVLPSSLGARLGIDKSTASRLVARLTDRGDLESITTSDGRTRPVRLSRRGLRTAREVEAASRERFAQLLEQVPARKRTAALAGLRELVEALERMTNQEGTE